MDGQAGAVGRDAAGGAFDDPGAGRSRGGGEEKVGQRLRRGSIPLGHRMSAFKSGSPAHSLWLCRQPDERVAPRYFHSDDKMIREWYLVSGNAQAYIPDSIGSSFF